MTMNAVTTISANDPEIHENDNQTFVWDDEYKHFFNEDGGDIIWIGEATGGWVYDTQKYRIKIGMGCPSSDVQGSNITWTYRPLTPIDMKNIKIKTEVDDTVRTFYGYLRRRHRDAECSRLWKRLREDTSFFNDVINLEISLQK